MKRSIFWVKADGLPVKTFIAMEQPQSIASVNKDIETFAIFILGGCPRIRLSNAQPLI